jgi:hypothetical protein
MASLMRVDEHHREKTAPLWMVIALPASAPVAAEPFRAGRQLIGIASVPLERSGRAMAGQSARLYASVKLCEWVSLSLCPSLIP